MPETLNENDFVEIDYTGKVVDGNIVFDTTSEEIAKRNNIYDSNSQYGPVKICISRGHVIKGLDRNLVGKELNRRYTFRISPEDAFGQKNPKMIQLIATSKFRQQNITPMPGLQVNMDGALGTVRSVSGGRTIVDFNHPLSGKELEYEVEARRIITDLKEKVDIIMQLLNLKLDSEVLEGKVVFRSESEMPKEIQDSVSKAVRESVPEVKQVLFETVTKKAQKSEKPNNKI